MAISSRTEDSDADSQNDQAWSDSKGLLRLGKLGDVSGSRQGSFSIVGGVDESKTFKV